VRTKRSRSDFNAGEESSGPIPVEIVVLAIVYAIIAAGFAIFGNALSSNAARELGDAGAHRRVCLANLQDFEREEVDQFDVCREYGRSLAQTPNNEEARTRTTSALQSLSALHARYAWLRESCSAVIDLPEQLNGRDANDAAYSICRGRTQSDDFETSPERNSSPMLRYSDIVWVSQPDRRDEEANLPSRATERHYPARVHLRCAIQRNGNLDCETLSEAPAGVGFSRSALRLARHFRAGALTRSGVPTAGAQVDLIIRFDPPRD